MRAQLPKQNPAYPIDLFHPGHQHLTAPKTPATPLTLLNKEPMQLMPPFQALRPILLIHTLLPFGPANPLRLRARQHTHHLRRLGQFRINGGRKRVNQLRPPPIPHPQHRGARRAERALRPTHLLARRPAVRDRVVFPGIHQKGFSVCRHVRNPYDRTFAKEAEPSPPPPPPKPSSRDGSSPSGVTRPPGPYQPPASEQQFRGASPRDPNPPSYTPTPGPQHNIELPPDGWVPAVLKDKSKSDLSYALHSPALLTALTTAPSTAHASLTSTQQMLQSSLAGNIHAARTLAAHEARLGAQRAATESHLLALHALERQWRAKQTEMDRALAPFSPKALYQRLAASLLEQEAVCVALEESFVEGEGRASEREAAEFVKRFREGRKVYYLRREKKERWDEGRVGGWR
ncbi:MAG: hypothetical protein M1829_003906 [Trizodia sp. TS-e1964]|nr:MAG: hypothetical protein M1829_003906 [Trizodia sp. TS-e1964]